MTNILVVDDTPANLRLLSAILANVGYKVRPVLSGKLAISGARAMPPDLILLDILMPKMDGYEVCRRLKAHPKTRHVPVIFISGLDATQGKVKAFEVGGVDYITKPFQAEEVLARVNTHLTLRSLQKQLQVQNEALNQENIRRKRIQELLKESRQRYRLLAENATDIISRQSIDGVYRYVSPACITILGREIEEMIGRSVFDFCHPEDLPILRAIYQSEQPSPPVSVITYRAQTKEGHYIWLETVSKVFQRSKAPQALEIVSVSRDVSERREMEDAIRRQNEELDAYAHTVAHDLRNPLGVLQAYAELLKEIIVEEGGIDKEEALMLLEHSQGSLDRLLRIVDELLVLASVRKGQVEMKPVNMAEVVTNAQQSLFRMIEEYQAEITLPDSWPTALGHAPWLEEVWANYISNGLKYGGRPPHLELGAAPQPDGMIRFWVKDKGPGISPEEQATLFSEFTRLSEARAQGHGLGLSIVQRIIDKLGGVVGVESKVSQGSLFYFTLPGQQVSS